MEMQGTLRKMARLPTGDETVVLTDETVVLTYETVVLTDRTQLCVKYDLDQVTKQSRDSLVGTDWANEVSWLLPAPPTPSKKPHLFRDQTVPVAQLAYLSKGNAHISLEKSGRDVNLITQLHLASKLGMHVAILIIRTNEMQYFSNLFWYWTLHVSDRFTVHYQESSTVYRMELSSILIPLASSQHNLYDT